MRDLDPIFAALSASPFRMKQRLNARDRAYLAAKGSEIVLAHARDFIATRLAPAAPKNDGKQTPMRGHPVFVAQHATATCCRSCLAKWHAIACGAELSTDEREHVLAAIARWLEGVNGEPGRLA